MRWLNWLRSRRGTVAAEESLDVEGILAEAMRDPAAAGQGIAQLQRERKALERRRRLLHKRSGRLTPGRVRIIGRSSPGATEMEVYQLSQAMRDAGAASQAGTLRAEQLAAVEGQIQVVDRALAQLDAHVRQAR